MSYGWVLAATLMGCSQFSFAIYGPSLTRAAPALSLLACQEAHFIHGWQIAQAMQDGLPTLTVGILGDALRQLRGTSTTAVLYPARAFCIHEIVPGSLAANPEAVNSPTPEVKGFEAIGVSYFYYEPDGAWILRQNPVDLVELAAKYLHSRWGRQAFQMMTLLGWSQGSCREGPDQFREVIKHGEKFLRDYPNSEVSDDIRLSMANAYATWWNLSRDPNRVEEATSNTYNKGAEQARKEAMDLYSSYLASQKIPDERYMKDVAHRLAELRDNPNGSNIYDFFCADYED